MKKTLYQNKGQDKLWSWNIRSDGNYLITSCGFVGDSRTAIREHFPPDQHQRIILARIGSKINNGYHETRKKASKSDPVLPNISFDSGLLVHQATRRISRKRLEKNFQDYALFLGHTQRQDTVVVDDTVRMFRGDNGQELKGAKINAFLRELKKLPKGTILTGMQGNSDHNFLLTDVLVWNYEDCSHIAFRDRYRHVYRWVTHYNRRGRHVGIMKDLGQTYLDLDQPMLVWKLDAPTQIRMRGKPYSGGIFKYGPTDKS